MKHIWVHLASIILMLLVSRLASAAPYNYKAHWAESKISGEGLHLSVFKKNSPVQFLENIASLTVTQNSAAPLDAVLAAYKKTLGADDWSRASIEGLEIYEKVYRPAQILFRIAYSPKSKQYSVASVRLRFLMPSYLEIHLMQIEKLTVASPQRTSARWMDLFIAPAVAQVGANVGSLISQYGFGNAVSPAAVLPSTGSGLNLNVTGSVVPRDAVNAITSANSSMNGLGRDAVSASRNIQQGLENHAASIRRGAESLDEINNTLQSTLSTKNVVELTAIATVSGVIFAELTNLALSGSWELIKKLYREANGIFSEKELNERLAAFQGAMETFKPTAIELADQEKKLTLLAQILSESSNKSLEQILGGIDADIGKLSSVAAGQTDLLNCSKEQAVLRINELEDIKSIVGSLGLNNTNDICNKMDSLYLAWRNSEYQMSVARKNIVQNFEVYMGVINRAPSPDVASQEARKKLNACLGDIPSQISKLEKQANAMECETSTENAASSVCRNLVSLKRRAKTCDFANTVKVSDDMLADVGESAANLNESIGFFAQNLSRLDCAESKGDKCVKLSRYIEGKRELQKSIGNVASQCPKSLFAQSAAAPRKPASLPSPISNNAPAKSENFFTRLWSKMFGNSTPADAQVVANAWTQERMYW